MYLDGNKLKELAQQQSLSKEALQEQSGVSENVMAYYWQYPVTTLKIGDAELLAKALHVEPDELLVKGEPKEVFLRPDKFAE